jgi:hypothetical protein
VSWHNPRTSKNDRIAWLITNTSEWIGLDHDNEDHLLKIARRMRNADLYSATTNLPDIASRIGPLMDAAKDLLKKTGNL